MAILGWIGGAALILISMANPSWAAPVEWPGACVFSLRAGAIVGGAFAAQGVVRFVRARLRVCFATGKVEQSGADKWPPLFVGFTESVSYPTLLLYFGASDGVITGIAAWIGLKTIGDWKGWQTEGRSHEGRRRLYAFMLCNACQVLMAWLTWFVAAGIK